MWLIIINLVAVVIAPIAAVWIGQKLQDKGTNSGTHTSDEKIVVDRYLLFP